MNKKTEKQILSKLLTDLCDECKKPSETKQGWHLKNGLNFCSNLCVANYLERMTR